MGDDTMREAPELGEPTDAAVGDDTAVFLMNGGDPHDGEGTDGAADEHERTIDTPDDLGGTGGQQSGGAG